MIYTYRFETELCDINSEKYVKNKALLRYFENVAAKHSDSVHNGLNDIMDTGYSWVLLEWKLRVTDRPKYGETLEVHTWVRNSTRIYSYRDFEVWSDGVKKAEGSSKWMPVDVVKMRPMKITEELLRDYKPEFDKNVFGAAEFEKMRQQPEYTNSIPYFIRKSDIDINGHVHNLNYMDMISEAAKTEAEFENVNILCKKEIKYGTKINIEYTYTDDKMFVKICSADAVHALAEVW